jgi:carbonic anhydrase
MKDLDHLFENNRNWAERITKKDPDFFANLSTQQSPEYLWIGCSDSRVPANEIIGLAPGELFVHRNIANQVVHTDTNCLSVIQYAVDSLQVKHIIICGHYGCGGVKGSLCAKDSGSMDDWLQHIRDIYKKHEGVLDRIDDEQLRVEKLCELNVIEQVVHVCRTTTVQDAWRRGQEMAVHGWVYELKNGLLRDLHVCVRTADEIQSVYQAAVEE